MLDFSSGQCSSFRPAFTVEAVDRFTDALSLDPNDLNIQFNLALSLLAAGHERAGLIEYQRGLKLVRARYDRLRARGILIVVRVDLAGAIDEGVFKSRPAATEASRALDMLTDALEASMRAPAT